MATRQAIRESLVEDWLAETDSGFYPDPVLNDGINWAYRRVSAEMGGIDTSFNLDTITAPPYRYTFNRDLIYLEKMTYNPNGIPPGASIKELYEVSFDDMFVYYGREWLDDAAGTPDLFVQQGFVNFYLYPRASSIILNGITQYGRGLPADLLADANSPVTPSVFDDVIGAGAFVYALRRLGTHGDSVPPGMQEARASWLEGLQKARTFARNFSTSGLKVMGSVPTGRRGTWGRRHPLYDYELTGG